MTAAVKFPNTIAMPKNFKNEIDSRYIGVVSLNPFAAYISASRLEMFCNHIGQFLVVKDCTTNRLQTGVGREYAKNIHDVRFPKNAIILKVFQKYRKKVDSNFPGENPTLYIVYEDPMSPKREIGVLEVPYHHCLHQHYGFTYTKTSQFYDFVKPNQNVPKDTIIATSPTISPQGDHRPGLEAQVAFMSVAGVTEDGVIVSKSFCKRMTTKGYGKRVVSWGKNTMPINSFGDDENFKPFPDIGESVGPNGLLFASRQYDDMLSVAMMSRKSLRRLDYFDKPVYAPGAKVVDITVLKGNKDKTFLPSGMDQQCRYYYQRTYQFHEELISYERELRRRYGDHLHLSPEFENLLVHAYACTQIAERKHIIPTYGKQPVDEWVVEITFEYEVVPTIGFKLTGMHGDKGVIVAVWDDEDMPIDASGNRAEIIMDGDSTLKRTNVGRMYEQYINASGRMTAIRLKEMKERGETLQNMWHYILTFYEIISPPMHENVIEFITSDYDKMKHIDKVIKYGVYLYLPTNNPISYPNAISWLAKLYPACLGPVTYRGNSRRLVTTKSKVLIGGMYILLLEKTGNTWGAVSSAKLQHFGIPAKLNNSDKHGAAGRHAPIRILGESELRLVVATCGGEAGADMLDQTNNPQAHRMICYAIVRSESPTNISEAVDRKLIPLGNGRVLTLVNHVLECGGIRFTSSKPKEQNNVVYYPRS